MIDKDIRKLFNKALDAGRNRNYKESIVLLTRIISSTDRFPPAFLYLARCYHALGDYNRSVQLLKYFIKLRPGSGAGNFFLGRSYLAARNYRLSTYYLKKSVKLDPETGYAHGLLGLSYLKQKRYTLALTSFRMALKINPDNTRIFTAYINSLTVYGVKLFFKQYYKNAAEIFEFIVKSNNDHIIAHLYLSAIYRELKIPDGALSHLDYAISLSPSDPALRLNRAVILLQAERTPEAITEIKRISSLLKTDSKLSSNPDELVRILINVHFKQEKFHHAVYYAEKLLKIDYHQPYLHSIVAESYRNIGDLKKARNHFIRAIEDDRNVIEYHYGLAIVLWQMKAYEQLRGELERILKKNPEDDIARYYYALALSKTENKPEKILICLQREIKRYGPDIKLMCSLGVEYLKFNLPELARGWFERTLKLDPSNKDALLSLIDINEKLSDKDQLLKYLAQYLEVFPENIPMRKKYVKLLLREKEYLRTIEEILKIISYETGNSRLKETLAVCYRKVGNYFEALLLYMDLLRNNPESGRLLQAVSYCKMQLGELDDAITLLKKASVYVKNNRTILLTLGALYYRSERYEDALNTLRKVTEISPKSWQAYEGLSRTYKKIGNHIFADKFKQKAKEYQKLLS